jgi:hypothetical protein
MDANRSTFAKSSAFVPCSQNYGGQVGATGHESRRKPQMKAIGLVGSGSRQGQALGGIASSSGSCRIVPEAHSLP